MASPWVGQTSTYVLGETYAWSHNAPTPTWSSAARVGAFGAAPCLHVGALRALCLGQIRGAAARKITQQIKGLPVTPSCACGDAPPLLYQLFHRAGAVLRAQPRGAQRLAAHPHGKQDPGKESCMGGRRQKAGCRERGGQLTLSSSWSWFSTTTAVQV